MQLAPGAVTRDHTGLTAAARRSRAWPGCTEPANQLVSQQVSQPCGPPLTPGLAFVPTWRPAGPTRGAGTKTRPIRVAHVHASRPLPQPPRGVDQNRPAPRCDTIQRHQAPTLLAPARPLHKHRQTARPADRPRADRAAELAHLLEARERR